MARIICGHFDESLKADAALQALVDAGFSRAEIDSFYAPPPGQNALHPLGGDVHADAGTRHAGAGAALGAAIGAAVGAFIALGAMRLGWLPASEWTVVSVVFGAGLGAYIGSFAGAVGKMRAGRATREHPEEPPAGRMIAILVQRSEVDQRAIDTLRRNGARHVWRAEGTWRDGSWLDFDPRGRLVAV